MVSKTLKFKIGEKFTLSIGQEAVCEEEKLSIKVDKLVEEILEANPEEPKSYPGGSLLIVDLTVKKEEENAKIQLESSHSKEWEEYTINYISYKQHQNLVGLRVDKS